jgi:hypothetical protein
MSTIPFLIKFARESDLQDNSKEEPENRQFPHTRETVSPPPPPPTILTRVQNETTDET